MGAVLLSLLTGRRGLRVKWRLSPLNASLVGTFAASVVVFATIHLSAANETATESVRAILLSLFHAMQIFTIGTEFSVVTEGMVRCPDYLDALFQLWAAMLFVLAPIFTFSFLLSMFKNISAYLRYCRYFFRDVYVFSELNEKSLTLASDIKAKDNRAVIVFTDVFDYNEEKNYELIEQAKDIGAICFKKDILVVRFARHSRKRDVTFFTIGQNETENLNHTLKLIELYRERKNTRIYVFSTKIESELLLTTVDKGAIKVRRINEVQSLINRILYEQGEMLFQTALERADGEKSIHAMVVGMGRHGCEMIKALTWYGQMDGYHITIDGFDREVVAAEQFAMEAPELVSSQYNGKRIEGEAEYTIRLCGGVDVRSEAFAEAVKAQVGTTYILVALGNDDVNINTAVYLRMLFERKGEHPVIQAIVYNSRQSKALQGIRNYRGQPYDIDFIGDTESSYSRATIMGSRLEAEALERHLKWGKEEEFWNYEYNYRSSTASAIHMKARIACGICGADKAEEELTEEERLTIETLEHRRWNAYMRAEGYIYSGSKDRSSRNDLAKMHPDLVDYASLDEEQKRKDSRIGTK